MPAFFFALVLALLAQGSQGRALSNIAEPQTLTEQNAQVGSENSNTNTSTNVESPVPSTASVVNSTLVDHVSSILKDLPTIKNVVIFVCGLTAFLIACLIFKIFRSGRRIRKTRKYDIITTPAERVEMAPLNEENDEEEDSTVFDVKYRYR